MITITGLDDFPTAIDALPIPLADGRDAIAVTHFPTAGTSEIAYSAAYLVTPAGVASKVGQSEPYGKDIACALSIRGTVLTLWVTEPPPGGSGAASKVDRYDIQIGVGLALGGSGGVDQALRNWLAAGPK